MGYPPVENFEISKIKMGYPIMPSQKKRAAIMGYQEGWLVVSLNRKKGGPPMLVRSERSDPDDGYCHIRIHPAK